MVGYNSFFISGARQLKKLYVGEDDFNFKSEENAKVILSMKHLIYHEKAYESRTKNHRHILVDYILVLLLSKLI